MPKDLTLSRRRNYGVIVADRNITFKNFGPFFNYSSKMNNINIDDAKDLYIAI